MRDISWMLGRFDRDPHSVSELLSYCKIIAQIKSSQQYFRSIRRMVVFDGYSLNPPRQVKSHRAYLSFALVPLSDPLNVSSQKPYGSHSGLLMFHVSAFPSAVH